ncbi:MAG: 23S rRNA pseudouridine2457 synthase [Saprospiraceae bacterium]|jgi:23S rRNA pseudouridine2457 synthase
MLNFEIRKLGTTNNQQPSKSMHRHFIIHKPYFMLSQFKLERQGVKRLLGELHDFPEGTMSVGRLDEKSEGLLFLTTDGKLSAHINSKKVEKEYYAQVDGLMDDVTAEKLRDGVEISIEGKKYQTKDCKVELLRKNPGFPERIRRVRDDRHGPTSWVSITLREGKFRQVRKMTAVVGFATLRLIRVRIGQVRLGNMLAGEVIEVDAFDL